MAEAFTSRTEIPQPVEQVWPLLTTWSDAHNWMPGVQSARIEGADRVGTTLVFESRGSEHVAQISRWVPGREVSLRSRQGPVIAEYHYTCTPDGDATILGLTVDVIITKALLRPMAPLLRLAIRRTDGKQLQRFVAWSSGCRDAPRIPPA